MIIILFILFKRLKELEEENKILEEELYEFRYQRDLAKWKAWREKQKEKNK